MLWIEKTGAFLATFVRMEKRKVKWGQVVNVLLVALLLLILFVPDAKAFFLQGLLKTGLFSPGIEKEKIEIKEEISFVDGQGNKVSLSQLKGKVVFINFWATWCPPCRAEMPCINELFVKYSGSKDFVFITVDADGNYSKAKKFLDKKKYKFPVYIMASDIPAQLFSGTLPTTVVFDKRGKLIFKHEGLANYCGNSFAEFLEKEF